VPAGRTITGTAGSRSISASVWRKACRVIAVTSSIARLIASVLSRTPVGSAS
jgi:hypothetical protein